MKIRNKKTGKILSLNGGFLVDEGVLLKQYESIAEFNKEWEDVPEEPKKYWCIDWTGGINKIIPLDSSHDKYEQSKKEIGNYFKTKEEAEKAVEKLKAYKRLKDKGFKFEGIKEDYTRILQSQDPFRTGKRYLQFNKSEDEEWMEENWEDLDICFGGGE